MNSQNARARSDGYIAGLNRDDGFRVWQAPENLPAYDAGYSDGLASKLGFAEVLRMAVERARLANQEGDPILSAWLPDAIKIADILEGKV